MINNLLAIVANNEDRNFYFDNFGEAALYALIGFLVVFIGIIIIIGIIWFVGFIMRKTNNFEFLTNKKGSAKTQKGKEGKVADALSDEIPDEVKAAIIAAIMAYYEEQEQPCQFTVKRIKRI